VFHISWGSARCGVVRFVAYLTVHNVLLCALLVRAAVAKSVCVGVYARGGGVQV
jgi:hypothetical protein